MKTLFYVAVGLSLSAIVVTIYSLLTAGEGFEDEEGFHPVSRNEPEAQDAGEHAESKLPPFLSAR